MSKKSRLKRTKSGAKLLDKARLSAEQRSILSRTVETAFKFQQDGYFQQAEEYYRQALKIDPNNARVNNLLGQFYYQTGNTSKALPLIEKAVQTQPDYADAYNALGNIQRTIGNYKKAIINYKKAYKIQPGYADAHFKQGNVLIDRNKINEALASYSVALLLNPNFEQAHHNFSLAIKNRKELPDIIGSPEDKKMFLASLLSKNKGHHQFLFGACIHELFTKEIRDVANEFISTKPNYASYLHFIANSQLNTLFTDQVFLLMLEKTLIVDPFIEKLNTFLRKGFATLLNRNDFDASFFSRMTPVVCAIAHQCYANEYVFQTTKHETDLVNEIKEKLKSAKTLTSPESIINLALLACYNSLDTYDIIENLPDYSTITNIDLSKLIQTQIVEKNEEKELIKDIHSLSMISDETSQQVRQMYEENPYPRWNHIGLNSPIPFIKSLLLEIAPNSPPDLKEIKHPEVLIAGCGTGRQPISCATAYLNSSLIAVDLSGASLAYAKRKADQLDIKNIEFIQGDILDLPRLNKKFDVIECAGVLHHMKDPEKGLRILVSLLKPSGYMQIGLYSEIARQHIVAAQEFARNHGFKPTDEGIRECRQALLALPEDDFAKPVTFGRDFYTTSSVRDLIFHVQEHRFTLPEITKLLEELNLEFLGFIISKAIKDAYFAEYGDDQSLTSLSNWNSYEIEHPETFLGMYIFWVRKKHNPPLKESD